MNTVGESYVDDDCLYLGGDPRLRLRGSAEVAITPDGIRMTVIDRHTGQRANAWLPRGDLTAATYASRRLGMEQAESELDVEIGEFEHITLHAVTLGVRDPEGVATDGLQIEIGFSDDYRARVFEKRCRTAFGLAPF